MDKNLDTIQEILSKLYKGIGQDKVFQKQKENKVFISFLSKLYKHFGQQTIGPQFLWTFLTYNMDCLFGRKTQFGSMVMLNWILSEKSIERWEKRNTENGDYFISKFLVDHCIERSVYYDKIDLEDIEELERERYFNTDLGFITCQSLASYNELSENCQKCNFKEECRNEKDNKKNS